ncbi:uracil-DNA glycosylase [Halothermothrix orenii]|uniref:Type-4 uracil-DNA glycosylase n=1 Tax=Halothermothrix orenii (strain H 168 / OCM 544 / DSM 9562) TaxID=373903 RepID=B8CX81_HALOH|nr:uracil-DNA glycosylase [Halothermothrix orenii]ACL69900.1 Uracil-DNA glycosylase [Halothermothrix orenii H 168]
MIFDRDGKIQSSSLITYPDNDYSLLKEKALKCDRCQLRQGCTQVVMGYGPIDRKIMFVGEGPGADEDRLGKPFVGKAGKLLTKILNSVGLEREDVYITNIVKCRPPNNRQPTRSEAEACSPILKAEIKLIDPLVIVPLGSVALKNLVDEKASIMRTRGKWKKIGKYYFFPTFHPAFLLRNPKMKKLVWRDFKVIRKAVDRIKELKKTGEL